MIIDTTDLPTIQHAEFDEETKCFDIHVYASPDQFHSMGQLATDLLNVKWSVPTAMRGEDV